MSDRCEECFGQEWSLTGRGDGKCNDCAGTGKNEKLIDVLDGDSTCGTCGGSGVCQTCNGEGKN